MKRTWRRLMEWMERTLSAAAFAEAGEIEKARVAQGHQGAPASPQSAMQIPAPGAEALPPLPRLTPLG